MKVLVAVKRVVDYNVKVRPKGAAESPEGPAPTMTTSYSIDSLSKPVLRKSI